MVDSNDWIAVRRYRIPVEIDTLQQPGYYKRQYIEYVDTRLDGMDSEDYYFINGR